MQNRHVSNKPKPGYTTNDFSRQPSKLESFIQLLMINRIISETNTKVADLTQTLENTEIRSKAQTILLHLTNKGIKECRKNCDNDDENITNIIFNEIILTKFIKEYKQLTTYHNKQPEEHQDNMTLLFNSTDLMCSIFQFSDGGYFWNDDLYQCSLVCTHWLYHAWNLHSIYFANLTRLIQITSNKYKHSKMDYDHEHFIKDNRNLYSMWQRLAHAKSVYFDIRNHNIRLNNVLLNMVSLFGKVEQIICRCSKHNIDIVDVMMNKINTQYPKINAGFSLEEMRLGLADPNYNHVGFDNNQFDFMWSARCQSMKIFNKSIETEWCNYIINHCDCSKIHLLHLDGFASITKKEKEKRKLSNLYQNSPIATNSLLKHMVSKFVNLKWLKIGIGKKCNLQFLLMWNLLIPIIKANNTKVEINTIPFKNLDQEVNYQVENIIEKSNPKINVYKIDIGNGIDNCESLQGIEKAMNIPGLEYLKIETMDSNGLAFESMVKYLDDKYTNFKNQHEFMAKTPFATQTLPFSNLKVIEIQSGGYGYVKMKAINDLLSLNVFVDGKICLILNLDVKYDKKCQENFESLFKTFRNNIYSLLIKKSIGINISLAFEAFGDVDESKFDKCCQNIYLSCLNDQQHVLKSKINYNYIDISDYWIPLSKPIISLTKKATYNMFEAKNGIQTISNGSTSNQSHDEKLKKLTNRYMIKQPQQQYHRLTSATHKRGPWDRYHARTGGPRHYVSCGHRDRIRRQRGLHIF